LERCVDGDERAWNELYEQYGRSARRFLLRLGVDHCMLDDTCQEVFLTAFRSLSSFRGDCSFQTWLFRLCVTQARTARRRKRAHTLISQWLGRVPRPESTRGELTQERAATLVHEALTSLSDPDRLVFVLYELEGVSGRETAEIAGCPEATVWRRLHYARKQFRAYIEEQGVSS
jgi:RNA polymerase sigma-70 factor (ECF subfamily)